MIWRPTLIIFHDTSWLTLIKFSKYLAHIYSKFCFNSFLKIFITCFYIFRSKATVLMLYLAVTIYFLWMIVTLSIIIYLFSPNLLFNNSLSWFRLPVFWCCWHIMIFLLQVWSFYDLIRHTLFLPILKN